jgi:hypothetical protein
MKCAYNSFFEFLHGSAGPSEVLECCQSRAPLDCRPANSEILGKPDCLAD